MTTKLPATVRNHALQIAHHEMGHYVVARALGFETGSVHLTVTMDLRHQGGASINLARSIFSIEAMKEHLEARIMVLLAGAMAQTLPSTHTAAKRVDKSSATAILKGEQGAEQDYAKVRELQHLLRNLAYPDTDPASSERIAAELKAMTDRVWNRTQKIIDDQAETIAELAGALVDGMVIVEQWGRPADTYEGLLTAQMLERLRAVQAIPSLCVWTGSRSDAVQHWK
jgi:ATP-dependent Zn protease